MERSMRSSKKGKSKVRVGLPSKKRKTAKTSQLATYSSHDFVANPNVVGARDRTRAVQSTSVQRFPDEKAEQFGTDDESDGRTHAVQSTSLQRFPDATAEQFSTDDESDDVQTALNKLRKDGKKALVQHLTEIQRVYVARLLQKHGDDYQAMSRDIKLNEMQYPAVVLRRFCLQYKHHEKKTVPKVSDDVHDITT